MGKLLDVLGIDATIQPHLPQDIVDAENFIIGLQSIYESSPESSKKDTLANTIAELVRLMLLEIQNIITGVTPMPQPQIQQQPPQVLTPPPPQPPQQVQPQTPPPITPPSPPRPPKPPKPPKPQNNVPVRVTCSPTFCEGDDTNLGIIEEIWKRPNGTYQYLINGTYYDESFVLPAQTTNDVQSRLDALEDELNEIQEAIVVFDTDEPEYQELNNRIIEIQNEINTLTP